MVSQRPMQASGGDSTVTSEPAAPLTSAAAGWWKLARDRPCRGGLWGSLIPRDICSPITGLPPLFPWVPQLEKPELKKMHKGIHGKETLSSLPLPSSWRS